MIPISSFKLPYQPYHHQLHLYNSLVHFTKSCKENWIFIFELLFISSVWKHLRIQYPYIRMHTKYISHLFLNSVYSSSPSLRLLLSTNGPVYFPSAKQYPFSQVILEFEIMSYNSAPFQYFINAIVNVILRTIITSS